MNSYFAYVKHCNNYAPPCTVMLQQTANLYTVEPLYKGHHWDQENCP